MPFGTFAYRDSIQRNSNILVIKNPLYVLTQKDNPSTQEIVAALRDTQQRRVNDPANVQHINKLLQKLAKQCLRTNAQHIVEVVRGLRNWSRSCSNDKIEVRSVNILLARFKRCKVTTEDIANVLQDLGDLAKYQCLDQSVAIQHVTRLLYLFSKGRDDATCQQIAETLLGVGQLVHHDCLNGSVDSQHINKLLEQLVKQRDQASTRDITNALLGVGYLAKNYKHLHGFVDERYIHSLVDCLKERNDLDSAGIAHALLGMGYLAKYDRLSQPVEVEYINALLRGLAAQCHRAHIQEIANALLGVGYLVATDKLAANSLDASAIRTLLAHPYNGVQVSSASQIAQFCAFTRHRIPQRIAEILAAHIPEPNATQKRIARVLQKTDLTCTLEKQVWAWPVDLHIEDKNGKQMIVELDGPSHHMEDGELRPEDQLRDKLFHELGYTVLRFSANTPVDEIVADIQAFFPAAEEEAHCDEKFYQGDFFNHRKRSEQDIMYPLPLQEALPEANIIPPLPQVG